MCPGGEVCPEALWLTAGKKVDVHECEATTASPGRSERRRKSSAKSSKNTAVWHRRQLLPFFCTFSMFKTNTFLVFPGTNCVWNVCSESSSGTETVIWQFVNWTASTKSSTWTLHWERLESEEEPITERQKYHWSSAVYLLERFNVRKDINFRWMNEFDYFKNTTQRHDDDEDYSWFQFS